MSVVLGVSDNSQAPGWVWGGGGIGTLLWSRAASGESGSEQRWGGMRFAWVPGDKITFFTTEMRFLGDHRFCFSWGYMNRSWLLLREWSAFCVGRCCWWCLVSCQSQGLWAAWSSKLCYIHTGQQFLHLLKREIPEFPQNISSRELRTLLIWEVNRSLKGCCCTLYDREIRFSSSRFQIEMKCLKFLFVGSTVLRQYDLVQIVTPKRQEYCQCQIFLSPSDQHW